MQSGYQFLLFCLSKDKQHSLLTLGIIFKTSKIKLQFSFKYISSKVGQSCIFLHKVHDNAYSHTKGEVISVPLVRFWSTLRPLIAWLLVLLVVFDLRWGGGGGGKEKPGRKKIQEPT